MGKFKELLEEQIKSNLSFTSGEEIDYNAEFNAGLRTGKEIILEILEKMKESFPLTEQLLVVTGNEKTIAPHILYGILEWFYEWT